MYGEGSPSKEGEVTVGVHGESTEGLGTGVLGGSTNGFGVHGRSASAYGGVFTSNFAQIRLEPTAGTNGPPRRGQHQAGELFVDPRGRLYYCYGGTPPGWQRLAGPSWIGDAIVTWVAPIRDAIRNALRSVLGRP